MQRANLRQHVHKLLERPHLSNLPQLVTEILQRELLFAQFSFKFERRLPVERRLGLLNQRHDVAHAQHARNNALRIKTLERIIFFAQAYELHRRAGNLADRKRRATARVAIELREDDARQSQAFVEFSRRAHRVLADHGVGNEQNLRGL